MKVDDMLQKADAAFLKQGGLIPAVVQDSETGEVLMLAYMDREALELTLNTGFAWFWSRDRKKLWRKGESSGNTMKVASASLDCDCDTVLLQVIPAGPACHTGARTCFLDEGRTLSLTDEKMFRGRNLSIFDRLDETIKDRLDNPSEASYTTRLLGAGTERILRKVAEESGEFIIAAMKAKSEPNKENMSDVAGEMADLFYHSAVALASVGLSLKDVERVLEERHGKPASKAKLTAEKV